MGIGIVVVVAGWATYICWSPSTCAGGVFRGGGGGLVYGPTKKPQGLGASSILSGSKETDTPPPAPPPMP